MRNDPEITRLIVEASAKPGGLFTPTSLPGYTSHQVGIAAAGLAGSGKLHRVKIKGGGPGRFHRYFTTKEAAQSYKPPVGSIRQRLTKTSAWPDAPRQAFIKLPTPPERFAPAPDEASWKLFSAMPLGVYALPPSSCAARAASREGV